MAFEAVSAEDHTNRTKARERAAALLKMPADAIEDDLLDFVIATNGDALLRARAGSGKTTALGIKVAYLTLDLGVAPSSIMMLTFNNAAARGLEKKLAEFGVPEGVRVRTFHALGQRIVRAHFGNRRRPVFDEKSEDAKAIGKMLEEALDEVVNEKFYFFCASRMRTKYEARRDYVESVGRDALLSAVNFLRARGYGLQNPYRNAWEEGGAIAGNAMKVILAFEGKLKDARLLDSTGVLQAASWTLEREIETGVSRPSDAHDVDYIFVDEYQDVSLPYMRLVSAIRRINGMVNVQGVGDSWQGINGFAGADIRYFTAPDEHLEDPKLLNLLRNRRSGSEIVQWGNRVMELAGDSVSPAIPDPRNGSGVINKVHISASRDLKLASKKLADLVDRDLKSVALIARKWKVGDYGLLQFKDNVAAILRNMGYRGEIVAMSAHGSKGLEWDQVLLLDDGSFPLDHPSRPILRDLIPEEEYLREEACLEHVAGTRAKRRLDVVVMK